MKSIEEIRSVIHNYNIDKWLKESGTGTLRMCSSERSFCTQSRNVCARLKMAFNCSLQNMSTVRMFSPFSPWCSPTPEEIIDPAPWSDPGPGDTGLTVTFLLSYCDGGEDIRAASPLRCTGLDGYVTEPSFQRPWTWNNMSFWIHPNLPTVNAYWFSIKLTIN